jgi:WD40 repeat protein
VGIGFGADGRTILYADEDGVLIRIDFATKAESPLARLHLTTRAVPHPSGSHVIAGSRDGWISLVDYATGALVSQVNATSFVKNIAVSPDGKVVATTHLDGHVRVWDFPAMIGRK